VSSHSMTHSDTVGAGFRSRSVGLDELPDINGRWMDTSRVVPSLTGVPNTTPTPICGLRMEVGVRSGRRAPDEILIFRDTLLPTSGRPKRLRAEIIHTVRHEVGHHLASTRRVSASSALMMPCPIARRSLGRRRARPDGGCLPLPHVPL